eukprot:scaffold110438_cov52-Attheya_sp.AAC.3
MYCSLLESNAYSHCCNAGNVRSGRFYGTNCRINFKKRTAATNSRRPKRRPTALPSLPLFVFTAIVVQTKTTQLELSMDELVAMKPREVVLGTDQIEHFGRWIGRRWQDDTAGTSQGDTILKEQMRPLWERYYNDADAILFVLDSASFEDYCSKNDTNHGRSHHDTNDTNDTNHRPQSHSWVEARMTLWKVGDFVDMRGPVEEYEYISNGKFFIDGEEKYATRFNMVAGGTGITPCMQIAAEILRHPLDTTQISLIFGCREENDLLAEKFPNKFKIH